MSEFFKNFSKGELQTLENSCNTIMENDNKPSHNGCMGVGCTSCPCGHTNSRKLNLNKDGCNEKLNRSIFILKELNKLKTNIYSEEE